MERCEICGSLLINKLCPNKERNKNWRDNLLFPNWELTEGAIISPPINCRFREGYIYVPYIPDIFKEE